MLSSLDCYGIFATAKGIRRQRLSRLAIFFALATCAVTAWSQTRIIPHLTAPAGGFTTTIQIENLSAQPESVVFQVFDATGQDFGNVTVDTNAGETQRFAVADLFPAVDAPSHFTFDAAETVEVSVFYDFAAGNGSPAQVEAQNLQGSIWRMYPGNWDLVFDGIAAVNTGETATDLWISEKDFQGNIIRAEKVAEAVAPNQKALYVIGSPDGSAFNGFNSYFELSADQPLAVTALRGTLGREDAGLLWANEAIVLSTAKSKRDDKGVWFIEDGDLHNVFEMMGYNVTVDRLYQKDLYRRNARGRMAEFFGQDFFVPDRVARAFMYTDAEMEAAWAQLSDDTRTMIQAYVDGTNRRVAQVHADPENLMPYEYEVLGVDEIEPWTYKDVLAWLAILQRQFSMEQFGIRQLNNAATVQNLFLLTGDTVEAGEMFEDVYWLNDPNAPTMIPGTPAEKTAAAMRNRKPLIIDPNAADLRGAAADLQRVFNERDALLKSVGAFVKGGSYAWVLSGDITETGNPMLVSGPQMGYSAPNPVCEGSIESDALSVSGAIVPGVPAVVVGRTPFHAWSFQVGHTPTWDFYLEPASANLQDRTEIIWVRNLDTGELEENEVTLSRVEGHGPIVNRSPLLSWKYSHWGYEFDLAEGYLAMARATNIDEFENGIENLGVSLHVLYADRDNNIAYWMSGRNPIRPEGEYRVPQGLVEPAIEYSVDERQPIPHDRNPEQGWYGGWNSKAAVGYDDVNGTNSFGPWHRGHYIQDRLTDIGAPNLDDMIDLEYDVIRTFSIGSGGNPWVAMREFFQPIIEANPTDTRMEALDKLTNWNGLFTEPGLPDNDILEPWLITRDWLFKVLDKTFVDELGPGFVNNNGPGDLLSSLRRFGMLQHALDPETGVVNNYDWFQTYGDEENSLTPEEIILTGLDEALVELPLNPAANDRNTNNYGSNPLGVLHAPPFLNRSAYTQAVEVGPTGPIRIISGQALGQSGLVLGVNEDGDLIFDPNFFSLQENFDTLEYRDFPLFDED